MITVCYITNKCRNVKKKFPNNLTLYIYRVNVRTLKISVKETYI